MRRGGLSAALPAGLKAARRGTIGPVARSLPSVSAKAAYLQKENIMARALILWLMGVPLFVVLLIWYFFF